MATILVVTPVHHPDDTRIREKLIRTLAPHHRVRFAAATPGPTDRTGLEFVPLRGGRLRRNLSAWRVVLFSRYEILSLHDPEMLPAGILARLVRRRRVIFDVHERLPEQARRRLPGLLGTVGAWIVLRLLRVAERAHEITLAEEGYADMLRRPHPVIPNHLDPALLPEPAPHGDGTVVYVGDVTEARGALDLARAAAEAGIQLTVVGRVDDRLKDRMDEAHPGGIEFTGRLPHRAAMDRARVASAGASPLRDEPNYRESLPTKVLEYAALRLPIVATDLPGTRRAVRDLDGVWLVPPGDTGALANALRAAVEVDRASGSEAVLARHRWPADAVLELYAAAPRT